MYKVFADFRQDLRSHFRFWLRLPADQRAERTKNAEASLFKVNFVGAGGMLSLRVSLVGVNV